VDDMSGSGIFSAGKLTFAPFGRSRSLGRFEGGRFVVEALPIAERCSGIRDFTVAGDGSVWFGTTDDPSGQDVYLRRTPDGRYTRVPLPPGIDVRGIYAESSKVLWVIASRDEPGGVAGLVLHTASLGAPVTLDPQPAPKR
jgi:hypothetical protein